MNKKLSPLIFISLLFFAPLGHATPDKTQLAVWANEAIVATYTFDYKNYLQEQKQIAKYFTADGWIAYSKALADSKLPETVQKNLYFVSAVATQPPVITDVDPTHWNATMNLLVLYQNPEFKQQQTLKVVIGITEAPSGQGVRGLSMTSLQANVSKPPCECANVEDTDTTPTPAPAAPTATPGATPSKPNAKQ